MRAVVVGMGIQGVKRVNTLKRDFIFSVDKFKRSNFKSIQKVPLNLYDTAFVCVPDNEKLKIIEYCLKNNKNVLVEKPLILKNQKKLINLQKLAKKKNLVLYTAYNHRFEPNIIRLREVIKKKLLGKIYSCKIFYGNGTAMLVKKSKWRDKELGVISDLGSHLIDLCIFLFGRKKLGKIKILETNNFENKAVDHAIISYEIENIKIILEMTLCMWKNTFYCDVVGSKGSAHLNSLCKWGKNNFIFRKRKLPSGKPFEKIKYFKQGDPTWLKELNFFKKLIKNKKNLDFNRDLIINREFLKLKKDKYEQ